MIYNANPVPLQLFCLVNCDELPEAFSRCSSRSSTGTVSLQRHVPNGRHRLRDSDALQRTAPCRCTFSNGRSRLRDSDAYIRSACKGTLQHETSPLLLTSHQDMWRAGITSSACTSATFTSGQRSKSHVSNKSLETTFTSESKAAICR